jgi:hypothetical protein
MAADGEIDHRGCTDAQLAEALPNTHRVAYLRN